MQISPQGAQSSPMTRSSFLMVNFTAKFEREHRQRGRQVRRGLGKIRNFYAISRHISENACKVGPKLLLMTNTEVEYALSIGTKIIDLG